MQIRKQSTIASINLLPEDEKRRIYDRVVPLELLQRFNLPALDTQRGRALVEYRFAPGSSDVELTLLPELRFPDPLLYGHITDTVNGQIHILLYILNDPDSPRFNVDRLPDGSSTRFGTLQRNLEAEHAALDHGLAPGQVRRGLRLLSPGIKAFEHFVASLGHDLYFIEPLYYHNAVIFERYGFGYQMGRRLMERVERGFAPGGDLRAQLDGSSPFRQPGAASSLRLRSWAIHDGLLGQPFSEVTMYKRVGQSFAENTAPGCRW
jgi:hypothetical protein